MLGIGSSRDHVFSALITLADGKLVRHLRCRLPENLGRKALETGWELHSRHAQGARTWPDIPVPFQPDSQMNLVRHRGNIYKPDADTLAHLQELEGGSFAPSAGGSNPSTRGPGERE